VSLFAKRRGFRVIANDVADRSVIVGRALIENSSVRLSKDDLTRLFAAAEDRPAGFVERVHGGEVIPVRHARFLDGALDVARATPGAKGALLMLLCLRYVLALRPMGNFGARTIVRQIEADEWECVNPTSLRDHLARRMEAHPVTVCEELRAKINRGVFSNGCANEVRQGDAVAFLHETEGEVVYLDPPYGGTSSYEAGRRLARCGAHAHRPRVRGGCAVKERERHRLAFERYAAMGPSRSLTRLAKELGVSESAVKQWSRELGWTERVERHNREVADTLAKESVRNDADERKGDEQLVRLGMVQIAKALVEGRIKPTMSDLDRMIRLKRDLAEARRGRETLEFVVTWPQSPANLEDGEPATVEEAREDLRYELERAKGSAARPAAEEGK
jgi:hypothetical protein